MLMSLDTSTTSRGACCSRRACTTPRIWLSALPCGRLMGRWLSSALGLEEQAAAGFAVAGGVELQARARCRRPARRPTRRACGWPGGRCGRPRSCLSCGRPVLPARSSAGRCRVPRSGTGSSGRASARWCPARTAWPVRSTWPCGPACGRLATACGSGGALLAARLRRHARGRFPSRRGTLPDGVRRRPGGGRNQAPAVFQPAGCRPGPPPIFANALCEERAGAS